MRCQSTCPYLIREDDTSGGHLGIEADITSYSCGLNWPRTQFICKGELGREPAAECVQGFAQVPVGTQRVTPGMLETKRLNDDFDAWDLMAGMPVDLYGTGGRSEQFL
jgi:hypothetical protein